MGNDVVNIVYADTSFKNGWDEELFYTVPPSVVFCVCDVRQNIRRNPFDLVVVIMLCIYA